MTNAFTPKQVSEMHEADHAALIDIYTQQVNQHLRTTTPFPAGHYDVATIVPMKYRAVIAKRFEDAGWFVSFNLNNDAYADHFQLRACAR